MSPNLKVIIGLGKTGFSCAKSLLQQGYDIAVVDSRETPPYLSQLNQLKVDYPNITIFLGTFEAPCLQEAEEIILSPGISIQEPAIARCLTLGISVIGDIELFVRAAKAPIIAITGANGKSTVTTIVGEMAKQAGLKVKVGGNLGTPVLELLDSTAEMYVLELSSFQLETTHSLQAAAATILNITPDHLDRYCDIFEYRAAKQHIFINCKAAVINRNDPFSYEGARLPSSVYSFGLQAPQHDNEFGIRDGALFFAQEKLMPINELRIKGLHQVANALAALALGHAAGLPFAAMIKALKEFGGLPHRCQWVAKINGVDWYNDSKGTNVGATQAAIEGLAAEISGKLILIAGGLGKDADFTILCKSITKYVRVLVLIGQDASKIAQALNGCCKIEHASSMREAVRLARDVAQNGDAVLLSPACASYDMFDNFEHRGEMFMREVLEIMNDEL